MRYFIHLAYNGAPFHGWQIQPGQVTVQETLERCLSLLLRGRHIAVTGCGRTDAGVHALRFYAHFDSEQVFSAGSLQRLQAKLNSFLPPQMAVYEIFPVADEANARFSAISRTYQYYISQAKNPFTGPFRWVCHKPLDIETMNEAADLLLHNDDFASFTKGGVQAGSFICHVTEARWKAAGEDLVFTITANRFLRNMVRAIAGTLVEAGLGKITVEDFQHIINQKDRCEAGASMPARALFLTDVRYPWEQIRLNCHD